MKLKILLILLLVSIQPLVAQTIIHRDPLLDSLVREVSADSLEKYVRTLASFKSRHTLNTDPKTGMPAAQQWVLGKFKEFASRADSRMVANLQPFTIPADQRRIPTDSPAANVIAHLKGTDPSDSRILILSAHMDSRNKDIMDAHGLAPGANDDGSGTALVLEVARILAANPFPATILFVAFTGEEQGLKGATYLSDKMLEEEKNLIAVLNNDIVGNSESSGTQIRDNLKMRVFSETIPLAETERMTAIRRYSGSDNDSPSRQLARYIKEIGERYVDQFEVILIYRPDRFLRGGDQTAFARNGFTAVRMSEMNENFYHQHENVREENGISYGDLPEFMDFEYLRKVSAVNLASLASLARSSGQPEQVQIDVRKLSNFTKLIWEAPAIGSVKGYYVLVRETSSPMWEKKLFTTDTSLTLPYSKDNYFFAVQSISNTGSESLPVFPAPLTR